MIPISDPDLQRNRTPYVTWGLLVLNVLVFLYQVLLSDLDSFAFTYRFGAIPAELAGNRELGLERVDFGNGQITTLNLTSPVPTLATAFTSMFMHGGFMHIAGNMVFLWVFGDNVEDRFGHVPFLLLYAGAGATGVWAQTLMSQESIVPIIGASGAIAGVLGAYLLLFPHSRINTLLVVGFIFHLRLPAVFLLGAWGGLQLFNGLGSLGVSTNQGGVAYFAHLGGFAIGLLAIVAYRAIRREPLWPSKPGGRQGFL